MRITGLASGLDIDSMVQSLMKSHKEPVTKLQKQILLIEQKQEAYRTVNSSIVNFRNNKLASFNLSNAINAQKAEVSGNTSAVSATATSSSTGTYDVNVLNLATSSRYTANTAITGVVDGKFDHEGSVTINGSTINYQEGETIDKLISRINSDKTANVTMIYSQNKLSLTSKSTGNSSISVDDEFNSLFNPSSVVSNTGTKATAIVNGVTVESDTNRLNINGLTIQLKAESLGQVSTITIKPDSTKILDTIKGFVESYNSVLDVVNGKLKEDKHRTYQPLTDEEKQELSDKQVELWESKSKSGMLKNDSILTNLVSNMRTALMSEVKSGSKDIRLSDLGITTGPWYDGGKLIIEDEAKLIDAIENNLQDVVSFFTAGNGTSAKGKATDVNTGVFNRLSAITMDSITLISEQAGTSRTNTSTTGSFVETSLLGIQKKSLNDKVKSLNARMVQMEAQYFKQFTAMETAINKFNAQASSLTGLM